MSSSRDTSREERIRKHMSRDRRSSGDCPERAGVCYCAQNQAHDDLDSLLAELDLLRAAFRYACEELAGLRIYATHNFRADPSPENVADVQEEYMTRAREQA